MSISSINPAFTGRRDNVDALIALDDNTIRSAAYLKTTGEYNHKKSRKITNALFYSAPIAAGLAAAILPKGGTTRIFSKEVSGLAARTAVGAKVAGIWTAALASIDLLGFLKGKLAKHSPEVREFDREHPLLSLGTMLAAGLGTIALVNKGAAKLGTVEAPKFLNRFATKAEKFINKNETIQVAKNTLVKYANKAPDALKEIGRTALDWAPTTLLLGGMFHSISSANKENRIFMNNYSELKDKQNALTKARLAELSVQNDYLMQDAKNREEMELLNDPLKDLPEDVADKIAEL